MLLPVEDEEVLALEAEELEVDLTICVNVVVVVVSLPFSDESANVVVVVEVPVVGGGNDSVGEVLLLLPAMLIETGIITMTIMRITVTTGTKVNTIGLDLKRHQR